ALVGDSADGYPGLRGWGPKTAARLIERYGHLEDFPPETLGENRELALLFKTLATLSMDAPLFRNVDEIRWRGPTSTWATVAERPDDARLPARVVKLQNS